MSLSAAGLSGAVDDQFASNPSGASKATVMMRRPNGSSDFQSSTEMMKGSASKGNSPERFAKGELLSPG
jgi:hypothetical protein